MKEKESDLIRVLLYVGSSEYKVNEVIADVKKVRTAKSWFFD